MAKKRREQEAKEAAAAATDNNEIEKNMNAASDALAKGPTFFVTSVRK